VGLAQWGRIGEGTERTDLTGGAMIALFILSLIHSRKCERRQIFPQGGEEIKRVFLQIEGGSNYW